MLDKKNIIFIPPLADRLKELHKTYSEGDDKDKYEILDVEDIDEANQLIPSLGPALILTSNVKTCALMLKANKEYIRRFNSKVILVTPQIIPDKTVDKLIQVGLNDYVKCPINPKSLQYKCEFLLKSIAGTQIEDKTSDDNDSNNIIVEVNEFDQGAIDTEQKQRLEKGITEEKEKGDIRRKEQKETNLNIIDNKMGNKKYSGAMNLKLEFEEPEKDDKKKKKVEELDKRLERILAEKAADDKLADQSHVQAEQKEQTKQDANPKIQTKPKIEVEIDSTTPDTKAKKELEILPDDKAKNTKGHSSNALFEEMAKDSTQHKDEENDTSSKKQKHEIDIEKQESTEQRHNKSGANDENKTPASTNNIAIEDIESEKEAIKKKEKEKLERVKGQDKNGLDDIESVKSNKTSINVEDAQDEKKKKTVLSLSDVENDDDIKIEKQQNPQKENKNQAINIEITKDDTEEQKNESTEKANNNLTNADNLDIELGKSKSKAKDLDIDKDALIGKQQDSANEDDIDKEVDIGISLESTNKDKEIGKSSVDLEKGDKRGDVELDIEKKPKVQIQRIDLDVKKRTSTTERLDRQFKTRKHHGELTIDFEKKNRGEGDTLDYSQIKKEYRELSKKLSGLSSEELEALKKKREDKLYSKKKIFEPHSKGIEEVIKLFSVYDNRTKENDEIIDALDRVLYKKFGTKLAIFLYSKEDNTFIEKFQSFTRNQDEVVSKEQRWETIKLVNIDKWIATNTIQWKDEHFESNENEFLFPFYQDNIKQGFAVLSFNEKVELNKAFLVEVYLECIRGIIIQEYDEVMGNGVNVDQVSNNKNSGNNKHSESKDQKDNKGLISRFFG